MQGDGNEFLTFAESPTKTRQGGLSVKPRLVSLKMLGLPRCKNLWFFLCLGVIVCVLYIVSGLFVVLLVLCFTSLVSFTGFYTENEPKCLPQEMRKGSLSCCCKNVQVKWRKATYFQDYIRLQILRFLGVSNLRNYVIFRLTSRFAKVGCLHDFLALCCEIYNFMLVHQQEPAGGFHKLCELTSRFSSTQCEICDIFALLCNTNYMRLMKH